MDRLIFRKRTDVGPTVSGAKEDGTDTGMGQASFSIGPNQSLLLWRRPRASPDKVFLLEACMCGYFDNGTSPLR